MKGVVVAILGLCGCGRVGFDDSASGSDGNDAALRYCATHTAELCSDFDDAEDTAQWTEINRYNSDYQFVNERMEMTSTALGAGANAAAFASRGVNSVTRNVLHASVDFFVEAAGTSDIVPINIRFVQPSSYHGFEYVYRAPPSMPYVEETYDPPGPAGIQVMGYTVNAASFPTGEWHRIGLTLDVTGTPRATVEHDGVQIADIPLTLNSDNGDPQIAIGLVYVGGPAQPWQFKLDNLTADSQ